MKPPLPTMPGHLRDSLSQLSQGLSPGFPCRNQLSNPFGSGLLNLAPPTLLSQFEMSRFEMHPVSLFSMKAFLTVVSGVELEAKHAQGRAKNDLSQPAQAPLRRSGALGVTSLQSLGPKPRDARYLSSQTPGKAAALLLPMDALPGRTYLVFFKNTLQSATPSKHMLIFWLHELLWFCCEKPH